MEEEEEKCKGVKSVETRKERKGKEKKRIYETAVCWVVYVCVKIIATLQSQKKQPPTVTNPAKPQHAVSSPF